MRTALIETVAELARADGRIMLLTADLGWGVVERFAAQHPTRFVNVGVAEANMASLGTGLALVGFVPYLYSIATFTSMRCYEQVRDGAVVHGLPVRIVGVGGGFAYGHAGPTHWALEDLALARVQPGMTVIAPVDPAQTRSAVRATAALPGPVYFRVGKGNNAELPGLNGRFALHRPEVVREGRGLLFLATGSVAHEALAAAAMLQDVHPGVAVLAHLGFAPGDELCELLRLFRWVVTVEDGYAAGGLGALVAQAIAERGLGCRLQTCGVAEPVDGVSGTENYLRRRYRLDAPELAAVARRLLSGGVHG